MQTKIQVLAIADNYYDHEGAVSLKGVFCDVYMPTVEDGDKEDLGADYINYATKPEDGMVGVNKQLLEALVAQCKAYSDNDLIVNKVAGTAFKYSDLNKLIMGMEFPM
ncbi:MAG: hypothetical protein RPR91_03090 [Colwellia sp.]